MDILVLLALAAGLAYVLKSREQQKRIALLGSHLGTYQIESLMENLTAGYLRALGEDGAQRQAQVWDLLGASESKLSGQFRRFADAFAKVDAPLARVSKLPLAVPYATTLFPQATLDLRALLQLHARALANATANQLQQSPKRRAFTLLAELMLMQHSCHWFCRSKTVASARLLARHQTSYAQVLESVAPATRKAYAALLAG